ncbi:MAG: putative PEP-binding protein [Nodosilinea sp.]
MAWLQPLDSIAPEDLAPLGDHFYYLGRLQRQQLPVISGWLVPAASWPQLWRRAAAQSPVLATTQTTLDQTNLQQEFASLQRLSQQGQAAFRQIPLEATLMAELEQWPHPTWWIQAYLGDDLGALGQGLLLAQTGCRPDQRLGQALREFWSQVLSAPNLLLWQHYRQPLDQLPLTTLITPIYPALASGRLRLRDQSAELEAILGLDLPSAQGEAWPARCRVNLPLSSPLAWQAGRQDLIYQLDLGEGSASLAVHPRVDPTLLSPLTPAQVEDLITLGQRLGRLCGDHRLSASLGTVDLDLAWLLCPQEGSPGWHWRITRVYPSHPQPAPAPTLSSLPPAPSLPTVSTVIQGIGAATGQAQGVAVVAKGSRDLPLPLPRQAIVVLPDLQPDVFLELGAVAGIVTERGGATCHAAILAREVGIPAVVGAPEVTDFLQSGQVVWLDGDRGLVYELAADNPRPAITLSPPPLAPAPLTQGSYAGLQTRVMANLSQIESLAHLPVDRIDGVGLLRSEWLLLEALEGRHPWDWVNQGQAVELQHRIVQRLDPLLKALGPKPVRYRSLDLRSHEWQALAGSPPLEPNPMLGLRGTLSYNLDDRLFRVELAALATLQRAGYRHLQLILPFVRSVEEVINCNHLIAQAGLRGCPDFALWIMAEVPSVLFLIPAYAQAGVQGITIGSNDLTQLLMAVDRDQPTIASAYDERHPVVRLAMAHLIQQARRCGMVCSICGQAPVRHPDLIADLVAWGISSISVEAPALALTLEAVWRAEQQLKGTGI